MRRFCFSITVVSIILLMISFSFAQSPRQPTSSEGKTSFTNIAVTGLDVTGVPSYIEMTASDGTIHYLYIDDSYDLKQVTAVAIGSGASPQIIDWDNVGTAVGDQTD